MANASLPPKEFLHECFLYDPSTGEFYWKYRPEKHFATSDIWINWNIRHSGTPAFEGRNEKGYAVTQVSHDGKRRRMKAHRVAWKMMTGEEPALIDHENTIRDDNRFINLRPATVFESNRNRGPNVGRELPKGVQRKKNRFCSRVKHLGTIYYLGSFLTAEDAHAAYCAKAAQLHGEFFNPGLAPT